MRKVSLLLAFSIILSSFASLVYAVGPTIQNEEIEVRFEEDLEENREEKGAERELEKEHEKDEEVDEEVIEDPIEEVEEDKDETKDLEEIIKDNQQGKNSENSKDEKELEEIEREGDLEEELAAEALEEEVEEVPEENLDNYSGYLGPDDDYAKWELYESGLLKIYGGKMAETRDDGNRSWDEYAKEIKWIEIGEEDDPLIAVKNMSDYFTKINHEGKSDFENIKSIEFINIDTSQVEDMQGMFNGLKKIEKLDLSGWDTTKLTNISSIFSNMEMLEELNLNGWEPTELTDISNAFFYVARLDSLDLSSWDTSKVTQMNSTFNSMDSLKSLDISGWDTGQVKEMDFMFYNTRELEYLDLSNWETPELLKMDYMFTDMMGLEILDISKINTRGVNLDKRRGALANTSALSKIVLGADSLIEGMGLRNIESSSLYSGGWIRDDGAKFYKDSKDFMEAYDGSYPGSYIWAMKTYDIDFIDGDEVIKRVQSKGHNQKISRGEVPSLNKSDYRFLGWSLEDEEKLFDLENTIDQPIRLRAKWERLDSGSSGGSSGSSGGGSSSTRERKPKEEVKTFIEAEVSLDSDNLLNKTDHMAYLTGYSDGTIRAENNLTREELASVIYKILNRGYQKLEQPDKVIYNDIAKTRWSSDYVNTLSELGIIKGYPDKNYQPDRYITRAEFASVIGNFLEDGPRARGKFKDIDKHWAQESIELLAGQGWIDGYNGSFRPNDRLTRAEMVKVVNKLLERNLKSGELPAARRTFKDLDPNKWYYWDIEEAANGHKYTRSGEGELWTELLAD